ncbi:MAG: tryptophan 2,3-dioxygenase [Chitinophagaceae bacterium]|nr:tryptophan 2,3-dioxygenase [Chitinophagaceae bacterium]
MNEKQSEFIQRINEKYHAMDQNPDTHLEGLVWAKPMNYWDYIMPDALLSLQVQRTTLPDEMVFIMYHQINELLFKMILWEIDQVSNKNEIDASFFIEKLRRVSRYFDMLSTSFDIMGDGMSVEQYYKFRNTLAPASGFQSAQYRLIEFASTEIINLIDYRFRATIDRDTPYEHAYEHLYWQAAGKDHATGKKSTLIRLFEEKYKTGFLAKMEHYNTANLWTKFKQLPEDVRQDADLISAMRHYDYTVNVSWVMAHYNAAGKYLGEAEATGGSDWRKYMHPKYQRRIFFPELWSADELNNWGENL